MAKDNYYEGMDAYEILGINKNADKAAIKAAYRKLVLQWHPDKFGDDVDKKAEGNTRLEQINRAYYCLSDEDRKKRYDMYGEKGVGTSASSEEQMSGQNGFGGFGGFGGNDISDIFESIFGGGRGGQDDSGIHFDFGGGMGQTNRKRKQKQKGKRLSTGVQYISLYYDQVLILILVLS